MTASFETDLRAARPRVLALLASSLLIACGVYTSTMGSFMDRGMPRAAYELQCPKEQLQVTELGDGAVGVRGCGKQAIYKEVWGAGWVNDSGPSAAKPVPSQPSQR